MKFRYLYGSLIFNKDV